MQELPGAPTGARDAESHGEGTRDHQLGESAPGLSIEELAEAADLSVRTIRYYISEGLLPGPGSRGKQATYGEEQLARLQLIRRLAERHVPLAQMRKLLAPLHLEDVRALLAEEDHRAAELARAEQTASPKEYVAGLLRRARALREAPRAPGLGGQSGLPGRSAQAGQPQQGAQGAGQGAAQATGSSAPSELAPSINEAQRPRVYGSPWRPSSPQLPASSSSRQAAQAWQRWELAPGVELQVRADAAHKYRALIRRVLTAAQEAAEEEV